MVSIESSEDSIQIDVLDFGCGMSKDVLDKVYDPFFSTKFTGRGLGMSVVFGVLKRMNGSIAIDSKPNQGTTVTLSFPSMPHNC